MANFITTKNLLIKRSQSLINGLSKNSSYTMYSNCLAACRVQAMDDSFNYLL